DDYWHPERCWMLDLEERRVVPEHEVGRNSIGCMFWTRIYRTLVPRSYSLESLTGGGNVHDPREAPKEEHYQVTPREHAEELGRELAEVQVSNAVTAWENERLTERIEHLENLDWKDST